MWRARHERRSINRFRRADSSISKEPHASADNARVYGFRLLLLFGLAVLSLGAAGCSTEPDASLAQAQPIAVTQILPTRAPTETLVQSQAAAIPTPEPHRPIPERGTITTTYVVRAGDTLLGIALNFSITLEALQQANRITNPASLQVGQRLLIPRLVQGRGPSVRLIPDSELVNGPSAVGFDTDAFVTRQGGYLSGYREQVDGETLTGGQVVQRVADRFSLNPRLLLAALEYVGGWVTQTDLNEQQVLFPLGFRRTNRQSLYLQLSWAAARLNEGYYGWRLGSRLHVQLDDGDLAYVGERINAGTAGVQNYLAALHTRANWLRSASSDAPEAFIHTYRRLFGDPWQYDAGLPIPPDTTQPKLELPWAKGELWLLTGGPHETYGTGTPWGAVDFAPMSVQGCRPLRDWVTAVADGVVARSLPGEVVQSLDPSGDERIGWSVLYLHIATDNRALQGARLRAGDRIGHPSCEGGFSTGAHVHIARKFNGEWVNAEGALPLVLGGWQAFEGAVAYEGSLVHADGSRRVPCQCKEPLHNGVTHR